MEGWPLLPYPPLPYNLRKPWEESRESHFLLEPTPAVSWLHNLQTLPAHLVDTSEGLSGPVQKQLVLFSRGFPPDLLSGPGLTNTGLHQQVPFLFQAALLGKV